MLLLLRYITLILAIIMLMSIIIGSLVIIKNAIEARLDRMNAKKGKSGKLPSDAGVREMVLGGRIDEATELYRKFTGVDEFTAQSAIQDIQREIRLTTIETDILSILESKGKAAAIQAYQDQTGSNFEDALQVVQQMERS